MQWYIQYFVEIYLPRKSIFDNPLFQAKTNTFAATKTLKMILKCFLSVALFSITATSVTAQSPDNSRDIAAVSFNENKTNVSKKKKKRKHMEPTEDAVEEVVEVDDGEKKKKKKKKKQVESEE